MRDYKRLVDRFLFSDNLKLGNAVIYILYSTILTTWTLNFHTHTIGQESSNEITGVSFLDRKGKANEGRRTILLWHPVNRERWDDAPAKFPPEATCRSSIYRWSERGCGHEYLGDTRCFQAYCFFWRSTDSQKRHGETNVSNILRFSRSRFRRSNTMLILG